MDKGAKDSQRLPDVAKGSDVDPLAEAEVYLAYGRKKQAIDILEEALRANSTRQDIRNRLFEITRPMDAPGKASARTKARPEQGISAQLRRELAYGSESPPLPERELPDPIEKKIQRRAAVLLVVLIAFIVAGVVSGDDDRISMMAAGIAFLIAMFLRDRRRRCPECGSIMKFHRRGPFTEYVPCYDCSRCAIRWLGKERDNSGTGW